MRKLRKPKTLMDMYRKSKNMSAVSLLFGVIGMNQVLHDGWVLGGLFLAVGLAIMVKSTTYDVTIMSSLKFLDVEVLSKSDTNALEIHESAKELKKQLNRGGEK